MTFEQILFKVDGSVARLTLNRPANRNAQSRIMLEELDVAFDRAVTDDQVKVIVLVSAGSDFSSGHDLGTAEELEDRACRPPAGDVRGRFGRSWELNVANVLRWRDLPKPTIAAVQGWCIYAGYALASAMDLIIAADDAKFVPGLVQYFSTPWDLTPRKAKEVLFQSRVVSAPEALELGLVNAVVARPDLDTEAMALAHRIAETDPFLARMTKRAVNDMQDMMGFRSSIAAGHSTYMLAQLAGSVRPPGSGNRLPAVEMAINRFYADQDGAISADPGYA